MSKTYYCHKEFIKGLTCEHKTLDSRCIAANGMLMKWFIGCDYCKDYPPNNIGNPLSKKVDWSKGTSQPIKSLEEKTCKTCKHSTKHTEWRTCKYYDAPDTDYEAEYYKCSLDGSRYFGMQGCKFYKPKPIKVKVKKSKR